MRTIEIRTTAEEQRRTLVDRLRGIYTLPVNDGCGPLNGKDTFTRAFETSPIQKEAAFEIETLRKQLDQASKELVETTAKACHEANKAFCEYLGDHSQKCWDEAPDWQRKSAINGVKFHQANPDAGDCASHNSWMAEKIADGWVWGMVKDEVAKTHPCIIPFEDLPPSQQFKDKLFRAIVHSQMAEHG